MSVFRAPAVFFFEKKNYTIYNFLFKNFDKKRSFSFYNMVELVSITPFNNYSVCYFKLNLLQNGTEI